MTIFLYVTVTLLILVGLWLTGRRWIVTEINAHASASDDIIKYHNDLVQYAESEGTDAGSMNEMMMNSTKIERLLGGDNWIVGARVVRNIFNGVPAIPFAIREIHEGIRDRLWKREAYQAVELVRNLLIRHIGRRKDETEQLVAQSESVFQCIALGWRLWSAIPLYILNAVGLMKSATVKRARNSKVFLAYSFVLFVAAVAAPVLSYLADRQQIDGAIRELTRR